MPETTFDVSSQMHPRAITPEMTWVPAPAPQSEPLMKSPEDP